MPLFSIDKDIASASTLPSDFYRSEEVFLRMKEKLFAQSWQLVEGAEAVEQKQEAYPFTLFPGYMNEPLVLVKNKENVLKCFSNVCTHRGNILVQHPGKYQHLVCSYHGRRFNLDGCFETMPEFAGAKDFPSTKDNLHQVDLAQWQQFVFVSLQPVFNLDSVFSALDERVGFLPITQFRSATEYSREYLVNAHWALYCDNYLEGFHIPFVHPDLNKALDYKNYSSVLYDYCNLQIGIGNEDTECFDLPEGHIDFGKRIAAYYFWIFPNMMFNFYPWGLSINIVKPMSPRQCKVSFINYIYDESKFDKGAGSLLDKVEREDEFVVENVQRGVNSRFYEAGRFSPSREQGVHHFHSLVSRFLS